MTASVGSFGAGQHTSYAQRAHDKVETKWNRFQTWCASEQGHKVGKVALIALAVIALAAAASTVVVTSLVATNVMSYTAVPLIGSALAGTYGPVILTSIAVGGVALGAGLIALAQRKLVTTREAGRRVLEDLQQQDNLEGATADEARLQLERAQENAAEAEKNKLQVHSKAGKQQKAAAYDAASRAGGSFVPNPQTSV